MLAAVGILEALVLVALAVGMLLGGTLVGLLLRWFRQEGRRARPRPTTRKPAPKEGKEHA